MSGLFGSITIKGNRLTDLVGQTSTVGKPIPFGFGRCKITEPNVIWTAGIPKEHVKKKKQGKGGVKTEEYTYTLSYAIAFMAGPLAGYLTIKRGGKVVYTTDPATPIEDQEFAAKWAQKVRFYYGTRTQLPDPTIESYRGAGLVSAFRDLAYIVVTDDDVTGEGGAVPQYEAVCVVQGPSYVTSPPYVLELIEDLASDASVSKLDVRDTTVVSGEFSSDAVVSDIEVREMRIVEQRPVGDFESDAEVVAIEVVQMKTIEQALVGEYNTDAEVTDIEVIQTRVVLNTTELNEYASDASVTTIEVIVP